MSDYGLSELELKIICQQIERRAIYRQEFLRLRTDPCKNAMQEGHVFDPAVQRFLALKANQFDYFQCNSKTIFSGITIVLPMFIYGYFLFKQRTKFERDCRCGRIKYKDRFHKLS